MEIHRVSTYHDVEHALRITDLKQSLYDEGKILMDKVKVQVYWRCWQGGAVDWRQRFARVFITGSTLSTAPAVSYWTLTKWDKRHSNEA